MTPQELARHIAALSVLELRELRELLGWDDPGGQTGVRMPRVPPPPSDEAGAERDWPTPAALPADYWETAQ